MGVGDNTLIHMNLDKIAFFCIFISFPLDNPCKPNFVKKMNLALFLLAFSFFRFSTLPNTGNIPYSQSRRGDALTGIVQMASQVSSTLVIQGDVVPAGFIDWLEQGRSLYAQRKQLDWACADWLAEGTQKFPEQMKLAIAEFATDPIEQKQLAKSARIAAAIPPAQRDASLTFQHHLHVADLPAPERLELLSRASKENLSARALRVVAMERRANLGLGNTALPDDDPDYQLLMGIVRGWNRAGSDTRQEFFDLASEADLGVIAA